MKRLRKWILAFVVLAIALAAIVWVAYLVLLPHVIRREVNAAFARVGLRNVRFDLRSASLWQADLSKLSALGEGEELHVGSVAVRYAPLDALDGHLESIQIADARLIVDLERTPIAAAPASPASDPGRAEAGVQLPFRRLDLESSLLLLKRGEQTLELPLAGSLVRAPDGTAALTLEASAAGAPVQVNGTIDPRDGSANVTVLSEGIDAAAAVELLPPNLQSLIDAAGGKLAFTLQFTRASGENRATMQLALHELFLASDPDMDVNLYDVTGTVVFDDLLSGTTAPNQSVRVGRITVAGEELTNATLGFELTRDEELRGKELRVSEVRFDWAGGKVHADEPFAIDLSHPDFSTRVVAEHVGLRQVVALVTGGEASGEGTVSGSVALRAGWVRLGSGRETLLVDIGQGAFRADAPGNLRLGEATDEFGQLLEQSDPRFRRDPIFMQAKEQILEAMQDFNFHLLDVTFRHEAQGELVTAIRLHGRGRTGKRFPAEVGLNVIGADEALNAYLYAKTSVLSKVKLKGGS